MYPRHSANAGEVKAKDRSDNRFVSSQGADASASFKDPGRVIPSILGATTGIAPGPGSGAGRAADRLVLSAATATRSGRSPATWSYTEPSVCLVRAVRGARLRRPRRLLPPLRRTRGGEQTGVVLCLWPRCPISADLEADPPRHAD